MVNILQNYENQPETMNKSMKLPWKIIKTNQKSWKNMTLKNIVNDG